uniref:EGF-like domain-containing protein n=1 Tax=Panagrellus redivivus TaxID=6233 RepID=A0A7E4V9M3_PANRE
MNSSYFLTGYNIQRAHVGTYECVVTFKKFENDQVLRSAVDLEVQDCFEDSNSTQLSNRNPCQYGACVIETDQVTSYERLKCECVEQYSGIYCEDEVRGTWWREVIFYSPIMGHFVVAAIIIFGSSLVAKGTREERISLLEDTPALGRVNLRNPRRFPGKQLPTETEVNNCTTSLSELLQKIRADPAEHKDT